MAYLGIDLGTSGLRALLIDADGNALASASVSYETDHPQRGWSEQDPTAWTNALDVAMAKLRDAASDYSAIRGIAVSGHMHGAVTLDADNNVIRPCILWNDTRSSVEAAMLDSTEGVRAASGNIVFPGFTAPKLLWMRRHEPENFSRVAKVLLPAAYMNLYLCGEYAADFSDSAGTSWLDVHHRKWSKQLLDVSGMDRTQMPALADGCAAVGTLRPTLAAAWGLSPDVVIAAGAGDNAAAACGIGAIEEGRGFVSLGTSGVLLMARDSCQPAPETALHTFCHAVPDKWYQMGVMLSATDSLNWLSRISGQSPQSLTTRLGEAQRAPGPVMFLPYLSGERTPHNDADLRGAFTGLSTNTSLDDMTHAVLTGVAFGLRDSAEALRSVGAVWDRLMAIGGGAASRHWLRILATVLDTPLAIPDGAEFGAALGAARLALVAASGASVSEVMTEPDIADVITPDRGLASAYDDAYACFRSSYAPIKSVQMGA